MKSSDNFAGGQPTSPKAPARQRSPQAKALPQHPPALPALLAQLDQIAADVEARTDDRDAAAVAVAVRLVVTLARQQGPEGARLTPTRAASAAGLCWRSGGSQVGEHIEAAPSPAHLEISEATLEALTYLSDAQEAARRLALALGQHIEPRDLPDLRDDAQDLALCLDQLGGELGRCCYQLTGLGGPGPRSLAVNVRDLAAIVAGLRARLRPDQAAEETSTQRIAARIAAEHFARSA